MPGRAAERRLSDLSSGFVTGRYRNDIDGLRAIAVLAVVAFHAQFNAFPGGFIGVDVFFVISGYLIGAIIIGEVTAGRFSLLAFYERRVRRIFPALVALLAIVSVVAYFGMLPRELEDYARSALATTFSVSNIYFWRTSGYFATPAYSIPLLHTWSLAIEEQFYIFLPLFILLVYRLWPSRLRLLLAGAALISFLLSARGAYVDEEATFYLLHTAAGSC